MSKKNVKNTEVFLALTVLDYVTHRDPHASITREVKLKECAITPSQKQIFKKQVKHYGPLMAVPGKPR